MAAAPRGGDDRMRRHGSARSINAASFPAAVVALFAFSFASLELRLAFSTNLRWMSNAHSTLVIPGGLSLTTGARAVFFAGAGLAARRPAPTCAKRRTASSSWLDEGARPREKENGWYGVKRRQDWRGNLMIYGRN
jgi:hypothetical protein